MSALFQFYPVEWGSTDDKAATDYEQRSALISPSKDSDIPLAVSGPFVYAQRPRRDFGWWVALVVSFVAMVAFAMALQLRSWDLDTIVSKKSLDNPANCPFHPANPSGRRKLFQAEDILQFQSSILSNIWWNLLGMLAVLAASIVVGTVLLRLFESKPEGTVKLVAAAQLALPLCATVYLLVVGYSLLAILLLVVGVINIVCASIWRPKLPVLARLISVACSVVADNPNLFWVTLLAQVALVCCSVPFTYAVFAAQRVGRITHNPVALPADAYSVCRHMLTKKPVPCCTWQPSGWAVLSQLPVVLLHVWVVSFIIEALTYVISGTVCQWYFTPVSSASCRGNVARSGTHLKSSLGTMALGSLVLYWVRFLRTFTYINDRFLTWKNPIAYFCGFCCMPYFCVSCCCTPCIERITKYATHRAAISGHGFHHANTVMHNTMRHSRLNHIGMGWLPPFILRFSSVTLAITAGFLVVSSSRPGSASSVDKMVPAIFRADVVCAAVMLAFSLAADLLLRIMDSLYVCFALDREQQTCTKNIVHDIFTHVPSIGPIWDDEDGASDGVALGVPAMRDEPATTKPQYSAPASQRV